MKKLFILILGVVTYGGATAQTTEDARRVILGDDKRNTRTEDRREERTIYGDGDRRTSSKSKTYKGKKYGKTNNPGKRLGWEKGVGNPHRSGGYNQKQKATHKGKGKKH